MANKDLMRFRHGMLNHRTELKNFIQGILMHHAIKIKGSPFIQNWITEVRRLKDYRIYSYQNTLSYMTDQMAKANVRIRDAVSKDPDAHLLYIIPGAGHYLTLILPAEIDGIDCFFHFKKLVAYASVMPSVRSSRTMTICGSIILQGNYLMRYAPVQVVQHNR